MTPYVKIPLWVFRAMETGHITHDQLDVLCFAYHKADWRNFTVSSYSAENMCRFLRLDATDANLKRYRRAVLDLVVHGIIRYDYRRGDKRPFHLFLPPADTENIESLYVRGVVRDPVRDPVGDSVSDTADLNLADSVQCPENKSDGVRDSVGAAVRENPIVMSAKDQGNPKSTERDPLNPPTGDFSPAPLPPGGERSGAAGLQSQKRTDQGTGKRSLTAEQCAQLKDAAVLYADFSTWLFGFSPDVDHVKALLRDFKSHEILFAQIERFGLIGSIPKTTMAQFFYKSARTSIEAARLKGTSSKEPENLTIYIRDQYDKGKDFQSRWDIVATAWKKIRADKNAIAEELQSNCTVAAAPVAAGEKL